MSDDPDFEAWYERVKANPETIVAWLRRMAKEIEMGYVVAGPAKRFTEAADEIERLRSDVKLVLDTWDSCNNL